MMGRVRRSEVRGNGGWTSPVTGIGVCHVGVGSVGVVGSGVGGAVVVGDDR